MRSSKKDKPVQATKTLVGKWKQTAGAHSPAYFGETDYFSSYLSCEKDDIIEFKTGNTFEFTEGTTKCDAPDPQVVYTGNYTVNMGVSSITMNGQPSDIELTSTTLTIKHPFSEGGVNYSDTAIFQRQ